MAQTVHLTLFVGDEQIEGDSTETTLGRENTIQCFVFEQAGRAPQSLMGATGRRSYQPLRIVKAIDRATPLLAQAFSLHKPMVGTFRFYRPNPNGDGTTEQFFTIEIRNVFVNGVRQFVTDTDVATEPPLEEVTFVFHTISWTFADGGVTYEDTWTGAS